MNISKLLLIFFLFQNFHVAGQNASDQVAFESAFSWVERKMTFNYFDPTNEHWWVNRFQANEDGTVTIKNIAAKHPDKVLEKKYHNRTFYLYDLNPRSISIIDLPSDQGRFVKGKIIRVECFVGEKDISVKKDGVVGSKVSFLHVSVPEILLDSTENYADELKSKLAEVAFLDARLFNTGNVEDNITSAFKALRGNYISEDSSAVMKFEVLDVGLVRFKLTKDHRLFVGTIGYDVKRKSIFFFLAGNKHYEVREFGFDEETMELILKTDSESVHVIGRNTIQFDLEEVQGKFYRY